MNQRERNDLDNYITGNYGNDQFQGGWIIHQKGPEELFWSSDGWVGIEDAEIYTSAEKEKFSLPINGEWECLE